MSYNTGNALGSFQIINHTYLILLTYTVVNCENDNQKNVVHSGQEQVTRFSIIKVRIGTRNRI